METVIISATISFFTFLLIFGLIGLYFNHQAKKEEKQEQEQQKEEYEKQVLYAAETINSDSYEYKNFKNYVNDQFEDLFKKYYGIENSRKTLKDEIIEDVYTQVLKDHKSDIDRINEIFQNLKKEITKLKSVKNVSSNPKSKR